MSLRAEANAIEEMAGAAVKIGAGFGVLIAIGLVLGVPTALAEIAVHAMSK